MESWASLRAMKPQPSTFWTAGELQTDVVAFMFSGMWPGSAVYIAAPFAQMKLREWFHTALGRVTRESLAHVSLRSNFLPTY